MSGILSSLLGIDTKKRHTGRWYVYELLDPRFNPPRVFYVGKGSGDRVEQHEIDTKKYLKTRASKMYMGCRHKRIVEIWDDGHKVGHRIVERFEDENEAYCFEAHRIEHYGLEKLCNETYGSKTKCKQIGQK